MDMKKINIVGLGPGSREYILPAAYDVIENADVVIGSKRAFASIDAGDKEAYFITSDLNGVKNYIDRNRMRNVAVIASGDPGFYGILEYLKTVYPISELKVIPGLSSFQYLAASLAVSWHDAYLGSIHGRSADIEDIVKRFKTVFLLTDNESSCQSIITVLFQKGFYEKVVYIGSNLSYPDEEIIKVKISDYKNEVFNKKLSVAVITDE